MVSHKEIKIPVFKVRDLQWIEGLMIAKTIDGQIMALSNLLRIDRDVLYRMDITDFNKLVSTVMEQMSGHTDGNVVKKFEGYELIDFDNLPLGWFVDYETIMHEHNGEMPANYVMAFSYIEKGKDWHEGDFKKRLEAMNEAPLYIYLRLASFFLRWRKSGEMLRKWITQPKKNTSEKRR